MQNDVEAITDEIRENVVIDAMQQAIDAFEKAFHEQIVGEAMLDYDLISATARQHLAKFLTSCGFGDALTRLIYVLDDLAVLRPSDIPDKALKRTLVRLCKEHEIKLLDMRELAEALLPEDEEPDLQSAFAELQSRYAEVRQEYETAVKLSHQYQEMRVPAALKRKYEETRDAYNIFLEEYPEFN